MKEKTMSFLLVCIALFTFSFAPQTFKFTSEEGKMTVTFPAEFESTSDKLENGKTGQAIATVGDMTYMATYTIHEVEISGHEELAESSLETFSNKVGGTITEQSTWLLSGNKGMQASISIKAEEDALVQYHVILVGSIQYQVLAVGTQASWEQKAVDAFIKSFKLLK